MAHMGTAGHGQRKEQGQEHTDSLPDNIEFKILDYSNAGDDTVSFKLEDGTVVKVKVGIERVGVAMNYKNPDGSPHYAVNTSVKLYIIPHDKRFTLSRAQVKGQTQEYKGSPPGNARPPPSHIT